MRRPLTNYQKGKIKIVNHTCRRCGKNHCIETLRGTYSRVGRLCKECNRKSIFTAMAKTKLKNKERWCELILGALAGGEMTVKELYKKIGCSYGPIYKNIKELMQEEKVIFIKDSNNKKIFKLK